MLLSRRRVLHVWAWFVALLASGPLAAAQEVNVAGVHFPPYVIKPEQPSASGLLLELLAALNAAQDDYRFVMVPSSLPRRFRDFQQGRIDLAIFENPAWGWQRIPHEAVDMGLEDAEVFVARLEAGRDQSYFDALEGKRLALYNGYHYAFADFNSDPEFLQTRFNATLTYSHDSNLLMVLRRRADIALVTRSYIGDFLERNRGYAGRLLVSDRIDQRYKHYVLVRPQAPISAERFAGLLEQLRHVGQLAEIFGPSRVAVRLSEAGTAAVAD
ncbi:transporter substrate-binding domain-containing protein [Pseudomonas lalucatii]|uniref:Transporter substrate-binding domain-containing protein n=1 Tax=Pseudomonas lalucatii TaxID=1424203 RepID=A0ABS5PXD7_9PSED|nr:transporter substrate-binding domain-containing protein [Pseudomonas lalucatii]MBS7661170.1 transporter substrate-binding domain-containing protein [Pseudomonas lalucatii]MBS7724247.1 transporter substrate-binding domain-containing protein [Pseudomonas lalucatii]QVM87765.1 transporter substrate-binding domain-containing protein [Pseudomonas lalucatii]